MKKSGVLGGEGVEGEGGLIAQVDLEVQECFGKQDHVAHLQGAGVQDIVVTDEARVSGILENEQLLGYTRVGVEGHHPTEPGVGDDLRVDAGEFLWAEEGHDGPYGCLVQFKLWGL